MAKKLLNDSTIADMMDEIHSSLQDYEPTAKYGMVINRQSRYITWDFTQTKFDTLELLHITDVQYGQKECDVDRLHEYLGWELAEENRYIFLGGDLGAAARKKKSASLQRAWPPTAIGCLGTSVEITNGGELILSETLAVQSQLC